MVEGLAALATGRALGGAVFLPFAGFADRPFPRVAAFGGRVDVLRAAGRAGLDARAEALAPGFFEAVSEREERALLGIVGG